MARCKHEWKPVRGTTRERCALCHTTYPCLLDCGHFDCRMDKGQPLPDWAGGSDTGTGVGAEEGEPKEKEEDIR